MYNHTYIPYLGTAYRHSKRQSMQSAPQFKPFEKKKDGGIISGGAIPIVLLP
jgi:hypothetical protein